VGDITVHPVTTPTTTAETDVAADVRTVALTMVRDEREMLPRWVRHYGSHLGLDNLIVLDDNSQDGSTHGLPCTVQRLPPPRPTDHWGAMRLRLANGLAAGLLAYYDAVIFTDVDEFLVPDPARYSSIPHYLAARPDRQVLAPLAFDVVHNAREEPPIDPERPVLEQRRYVKFNRAMCKPQVKRGPVRWGSAFHAVKAPFDIDPDLVMLHLKFFDERALRETGDRRRAAHETDGRGHANSFWPRGGDALVKLMARSFSSSDQPVTELEPATIDTSGMVISDDQGYYSVDGRQITSMKRSPLHTLPERFRHAL
jgi:hypothetical protein